MSSEILAREATTADLDFVGQDGCVSPEIVARRIERHEVVVAECDGRRVGYVRLEYLWSLIPYIGMIRVSEDHRRRGVGRAMLGFIEAFLRERGHEALYSSSQADEPEPQAWHRHMGFQECGIITGMNEGGVGEVFFRKRLTHTEHDQA